MYSVKIKSTISSMRTAIKLIFFATSAALLTSCGGGDEDRLENQSQKKIINSQKVSRQSTIFSTTDFWISARKGQVNVLLDKLRKIPNTHVIKTSGEDRILIRVDSNQVLKGLRKRIESGEIPEAVGIFNDATRPPGARPTFFATPLPNDGSDFYDLGDNWHLESSGIRDAWNISTGSNQVTVAILDSGFFINHEDISPRKSTITNLAPDYKDDHGTAVLGVVGGATNNGKGVSGINWGSPLIVNAINNFESRDTELKSYELLMNSNPGISAINNSWGPFDECPGTGGCTTKEFAIKSTAPYRDKANIYSSALHVWASGNDGADANLQNGAIHYNANGELSPIANILVVGAVLKNGSLASYSNFGESVDIAAPTEFKAPREKKLLGGSKYFMAKKDSKYGTNDSGAFDGTSASAPVVTGAASLIKSANMDLTPSQIKDLIITATTKFATTRTLETGGKESLQRPIPILDARRAMSSATSQSSCGTVTSPEISGQSSRPNRATINQVATFITTGDPKAGGIGYSKYHWKTSDGRRFTTTDASVDIQFDRLGYAWVEVFPELTDGTVCVTSIKHADIAVVSSLERFLSPVNGNEYEIVTCGTWTQCRDIAISLGGNLATVRSADENAWLVATFSPYKNSSYGWWIGYTDEMQEGNFQWASGQLSDYSNWGPGEPNNYGGRENYTHMTFFADGQYAWWNDIPDDIGLVDQAIIEYRSTSNTACPSTIKYVSLSERFSKPLSAQAWSIDTGGGSVTSGNGVLSLSAAANSTRFPYIEAIGNPFPSSGNYSLFCRSEFVDVSPGSGTGPCVATANVIVPGSVSWTYDTGSSIGIWGGGGGVTISGTDSVGVIITSATDKGIHDYEMCVVNDTISLYVDGVLKGSSATTPNWKGVSHLWIGNPVLGGNSWATPRVYQVEVRHLN